MEQDVFSFGVLLASVITRKTPGRDGFLERGPRRKFAVDIDELRCGRPLGSAGVGARAGRVIFVTRLAARRAPPVCVCSFSAAMPEDAPPSLVELCVQVRVAWQASVPAWLLLLGFLGCPAPQQLP